MPSPQVRIPPPLPIQPPALPAWAPPAPDETDTLGGRLQWALALAGCATMAFGEGMAIRWAIDQGWGCLAGVGLGALGGTVVAGAWIGQKIRAVWRRDARLEADHETATAMGLDLVETAYATIFDSVDAYAASQYRMRRRRPRLVQVTDGAKTYWLDEANRVWRRADAPATGDNNTPGVKLSPETDRPTNQLPPSPPLPALTRQQAAFLALLYQDRAYGARAVIGPILTRPEYDAVIAAFLGAGVIYKNEGKTFVLAPALANWREAWPGAGPDMQQQIADRAVEWARRQLAGLQP